MKRRATLIALAMLLILASIVSADGVPTIDWWVVGGGGGSADAGSYRLSGTVGQPIAGIASGSTRQLCAGFWCGAVLVDYVYLPLIILDR